MSNPLLPDMKRPRMDLSLPGASALMGALNSAMPLQGLPIDDGGLSDDEDSLKRKIPGMKQTAEAKRSQHCEVEKRRREKMNRYMAELAQMIPACSAVPRKLDKLSILKMAVDHMKNLRGDPHSDSDYKPAFLTDQELKKLVVEAANGFMLIVNCDKARVLYVSDTMEEVLHESPENWLGNSFYDLLHSNDVQKVKEQLASFDIEKALAAGTKQNSTKSPLVMHPQSMNGLRRSFLCRVKRAMSKDDNVTNSMPNQSSSGDDFTKSENMIRLIQSSRSGSSCQYAVLHCTGFIRNLTPAERQTLKVDKDETGACLIAVCRLQHFGDNTPNRTAMSSNDNEFVARVGTNGRFTYVDPRVTNILGYLPQDIIGQVSYEYYHPEDINKMVQLHHDAMKQRGPMPTVHYRFLAKNQKWIWLAMKAFSFINPFSQQVEYVVCTNVAHTRPAENPTDNPEETPAPADQLFNPSTVVQSNRVATEQLPTSRAPEPPQQANNWNGVSSQTPNSTTNSVVVSQPANITVEENAATAHRIVDEYIKFNQPPVQRKDYNYGFPPGLFPAEVDLEGSAQAFHHLLDGLDANHDLQQLLNQVDADPFKPSNIFNDLDFDVFD